MKLKREPAKTSTTAATDVCVARQPIFGTAGEVAGYELLYGRTASDRTTTRVQRREPGANVVVHAILDIGLDRLTAGRAAYVDFTCDMLLSGAYTLLPREHVVVELVGDLESGERIETACEELVDAGYALALDYFAGGASFRRLMELATVVKVDVLDQPPARLDEIAQELALYDVRLLAERIERAEVRALCAGLGYELFQGYYYAHPELVRNRSLTRDELSIMQGMTVLRDPRATDVDAEAAFSTDGGLSHRLLRMVNSAAHGGAIESIGQAVRLGGREELSKWLGLLLVSAMAARGSWNRELLHLAVQRARLCELLAATTGRVRDTNACFLTGLFSLLDAIAGIPMGDLLDAIVLEPALRDGLMARAGPYAAPLSIVEAYERGEWANVRRHASSAGLDESEVGALYVRSLAWARERLRSLSAA